MLSFIKEKVKNVYSSFTKKAAHLFSKKTVDETLLGKLETLLLSSDFGTQTTEEIIEYLKTYRVKHNITEAAALKEPFRALLCDRYLKTATRTSAKVVLLVGVNGSGKTTFAAKYAHLLEQHGKKVLLVAADTFRAAAVDQLTQWAQRINVHTFSGKKEQDPASVVFDGCMLFHAQGYDHLIIDTAGRLQTKTNLMRELAKIRATIMRHFNSDDIETWLTIDAMLGQNALTQARLFHESTQVTGLVLTKYDGTGKGGTVVSIARELALPVTYVTFGEEPKDLKPFKPHEYIRDLVS